MNVPSYIKGAPDTGRSTYVCMCGIMGKTSTMSFTCRCTQYRNFELVSMTWDEGLNIRAFSVCVILSLIHSVCSLAASSSIDHSKDAGGIRRLLAKTKETFKLADLQYLEATVQADSNYNCHRVLMDAATGSSLFLLDQLAPEFEALILGKNDSSQRHANFFPSSLRACEWVGEIICQSLSAEELLKDLSATVSTREFESWTLNYLRMTESSRSSSRINNDAYTQKTLSCCIAQQIPASAALYPSLGVDNLLVVDTSEYMYLVKLLDPTTEHASSLTQQTWSQRPFPYSSATNFQAAEIILNMLSRRVAARVQDAQTKPHLLDPTCGSGTFLALAASHGMRVTGWDSNQRCVEGCIRNLRYVFFDESEDFTILQRNCLDFVDDNMKLAGVESIDAVACNLPWDLNSHAFSFDNDRNDASSPHRFLIAIRKLLKPGTPCVFLYKNDETSSNDLYWESLGYQMMGHASIPQQNFVLPNQGKKKEKKRCNDDETVLTGRSNCVVSYVETI